MRLRALGVSPRKYCRKNRGERRRVCENAPPTLSRTVEGDYVKNACALQSFSRGGEGGDPLFSRPGFRFADPCDNYQRAAGGGRTKRIRMRGKGVCRRRRRRDIDRAGAVIGKTCLSILQSIIERHCHVNGNRIEIAMEMAAPLVLLRLSASVLAAGSAVVPPAYPNFCNFYNNVGA